MNRPPIFGRALWTLSLLMCFSTVHAEVSSNDINFGPQRIESEWLSPQALHQVSYAVGAPDSQSHA